ncbi:T9SS type A sorting domain-containing protein [Tenacibaculum jejuense]|uniref:Secretion system C-terminal sorting domain-containing protein n=1 Tax=Tenacibaculum jejuense TaxID=584609 RepID=A0A238U9U5_9FLAO|nr:T9SS type A sorting domain-containing protein [Tenacibaculum jejuense]SNR15993.1 Protein of unknown function precursor containing a C-terminal secretion signal [Tenacibaculum jejuense]
MKKITLLLSTFLTINAAFSQVTLDSEYNDDVVIMKFPNAGDKIIVIDEEDSFNSSNPQNTIIKIYNLDNSIYKTIDIGSNDEVRDISQHIVNNDDKLEFMIQQFSITNPDGSEGRPQSFYIINEDLEELFRLDEWSVSEAAIDSRAHEDTFLYQTSEGVKLVLGKHDLNSNAVQTRVYSLGGNGTLSTNKVSLRNEKSAYPNPSTEIINIPYSALNNEIVEIKIYDITGKLVEEKKMDDQFDKLSLNISNYTQGTYIYAIKNSLGVYKNKFIKK